MITIIKNIEIYVPEYLGKKTIVLINDKIEGIFDDIKIPANFLDIEEVDGEGLIALPGFIDAHVHLIGGGGEGGFNTRTPEIKLSTLTKAGITTVVGCLGTDGICRDMKTLLAKAYALEEDGITTYSYTGSYGIPVESVTKSVKEDIMIIPKIIGVGEIALSDHRSSQPTYESFAALAAEASVAGILAHKAGVVHVHLGDGKRKFGYLSKLIEETEIPKHVIVPTHCNRNHDLFKDAITYGKNGGYVDLTTSSDTSAEDESIKASTALKELLEAGVDISNIMFSSDGQGSLPRFDENRKFIGLGIGSVSTLYGEVKDAVLEDGIPMETAIRVITSNVADTLKLNAKGRISQGKDADLVLVKKEDLSINSVIAKGKWMIRDNEILVKGTFEE